ncbi:MAG: sarcosine oxidase subunit delta [Xanthomonadales bacterium]|nr:sarcosine oxidase subunit delta [Xanthomonadales bacterium]
MLRINCPWCGTRDQNEFRNGGEATVLRPADPQSASDDEWADYLFYRNNVKGVHQERWLHSFGCRQWFIATRDTVTHEFVDTHPLPVATGLGKV